MRADQHYHVAPHASLLGRAPGVVYAEGAHTAEAIDETTLRDALTARVRRRVRRDTTVTLEGTDWELDQGFLAGRLVMVARYLIDVGEAPWVEYQGKRFPLHPVDPVRNAHRQRPPRRITADALAMLYEAANGAHREIDRLATAALRIAARRKKKLIERDALAHVIDVEARTRED